MPSESDKLRQRVQELEELHRVAHSLGSIVAVQETLEAIVSCCQKFCKAERAAIVLLSQSGDSSEQTLVRSAEQDEGGIDHIVNTMVGGWITRYQKPFLATDIVKDLGFTSPPERIRALGSALAVPLMAEEKTIGFINMVNSRDGRDFTEADLHTATTLAPLAAQSIRRARLHESLAEDNRRLKQALQEKGGARSLIGESEAMKRVRQQISRVSGTAASVLLLGETGTGKELAARAIHEQSPRAGKPFVPVNCAAIPDTLVESELFGHEKGAFTGATEMKKGKFESAHEGTIFLDEISAMPLELQPKLLRVLEERKVCRVGSAQEKQVDVRVVAASNKNLSKAAEAGEFREDLFHRLNVFPINLPSLRERPDDIATLATAFLEEFSGATKCFTPEALTLMSEMEWKGNVRELRNFVERLFILVSSSSITPDDIRAVSGGTQTIPPTDLSTALRHLLKTGGGDKDLLEQVEKQLSQMALRECKGNVSQAARLLGIDRNALQRRIDKYQI